MRLVQDTEAVLIATAALINTEDRERLPDPAALEEFVQKWGWTGRHDHSRAELRAVQTLRSRLRRVWAASEDEAVEIINGLLCDYGASPRLVRHEQTYQLYATPSHERLAGRMAVAAAMAFAKLVTNGELSRLRVCEYPGCDDVVVDLSRNRSRRFCDAGCGNRSSVAAYRARKAALRRQQQ
ncbi:CGNR zinc finger domain-containing protein [Catellatospora sichuanensis]|uniref:CGNR zinc finger domain-containing protein n=1 Tax=Catellatospora sichuanensis TaxID=1969805 RepID=UPI003CCC8C50